MLNFHIKKEVKRSTHLEIFYEKEPCTDWEGEFWVQNSKIRLLNCLKQLNLFDVSKNASSYAQNQHHSSIQS